MDVKCSSTNPIPSEAKSSMLGSTVQGAMLREAGPSVGVYSKLAPGHFSLLPQCVHLSIASKMLAFSSFVSSPFLLIFLLLTPTSPSPPPCRPSSPSQQCQYGEYEDPRCGRLCYKVFQITTTKGKSKPAQGPGNVCGGENSRFGLCSSGLACSNCNRFSHTF